LRDTILGTHSSGRKEVVCGSQSEQNFASPLCTPRQSELLASAVMMKLFATINNMEPSNFYTGIVAELYEPLKSTNQAWEPYAEFIAQSGEPALELGCGDGEPILDLRRNGFDVDGIDSSEDMLARCAQKASQSEIEVALFPQRMEELDLPRRYRSIFLAGPTFTLLPDDETALRALKRIRRHLADGGSALVPLLIPAPTDPQQIGRVSEVVAEDGAILRCSVVSADRDEEARIQRSILRYEKHANGTSMVEDRTWLLHWYTQSGFRKLAEAAGLIVAAVQDKEGQTISPDADATEYKFILQPAL
jgi:ubiquinone/menaquinone biosynthesis C-methylase UbiE